MDNNTINISGMAENMMDNLSENPGGQVLSYSLLRDCAQMDRSVVERLRATTDISLEWAEQMLDLISSLDSELHTLASQFDSDQFDSEQLPVSGANDQPRCDTPLDSQLERKRVAQSVRSLRTGMRDLLMSMQHQDLIGQAIERAASALEQRSKVIERLMKQRGGLSTLPSEIAEIDTTYCTEDNRHRTVDWASAEQQQDCQTLGIAA